MGSSVSIFTQIFGKREVKVSMIGLGDSGKTSILYRLKLGGTITTTPTNGFNEETLDFPNISLAVWDIGATRLPIQTMKQHWRNIATGSLATIFVVDASDRATVDWVGENIFQDFIPDNKNHPLLVFANKQDIPNCMNESEIAQVLNLHHQLSCKWHIQACSAESGFGIAEGFDWLSKETYKSLPWW